MRSDLGVVIVVAIIGTANYVAFDLARAGSVTFWLVIAPPTVLLAAIGAAQMHRRGALRRALKPVWGDFATGLSSMLVLFAGAYAASLFLVPRGASKFSWTPGNYVARVYLQLGSPLALSANLVPLVGGVVVMAVAEEILWRGVITAHLDERFGRRVGWLYAVALYVIATLPTAWSLRDPFTGPNPVLPLAALGGGLVWGTLMRRHKRLVPGMISHALFLWCVLVLFRLWGRNV